MGYDKKSFRLVRHPLKVRMLEVLETREITPKMRRISLGGPELEGFTSLAPEDHVKLFFPAPGEERPLVPSVGPLGLVFSFGAKPIARDYTPRHYDQARNRLDIDFFLHGQGVASQWAARAERGQRLGVAGPRGSYVLTQSFDWQLFVGDETALPEISHRIEELPAETRAYAFLVVADAREEQALASAALLVVEWIHRPNPEASATERLLAALRSFHPPAGRGFTWIAGEASETRAVYQYLIRERGFEGPCIHASGHWKRGISNHDHHEEITP